MTGSHDARERLIAAAERLLTQSGPGSVSMDAVAAAAGAGKMSAYRHFASKQDLVAAALERHNPRHVRWLVGARQTAQPDRVVGTGPGHADAARADPGGADPGGADPGGADPGGADPGGADPVESILSAFGRLESAAISEPFRGCPFVDAALAAPGTEDRPGRIAWQHKQQVTRELAGLAARAGLPEPGELGAAVALTIDGAAVQAALAPDAASRQQIIRRARHVAEVLLAVAAGRAPGHWQELEERPEGPGERACPEEQP
jgi:AcrR family transcriptional regulator